MIKMTDDYPEDLLDMCLTRGFLDNFQVDKCPKCGRGDKLEFWHIQELLQYREDGVVTLEQYEDEENDVSDV